MILDTQILFGLRETDEHHEQVLTLLQKHRGNLIIPSISCLELILVMQSQNITPTQIDDYFRIINDVMVRYEIDESKMSIDDLLVSIELRE